jgi:quinol monooxygenase YgiN
MSVLVTVKVPGNTDVFRKSLEEHSDEFARISQDARTKGAIHHQFGLGDGFVLVVDEWESVEQFQAFFGDPELQAFIASVGGDPAAAPDITVTEWTDSSDRF